MSIAVLLRAFLLAVTGGVATPALAQTEMGQPLATQAEEVDLRVSACGQFAGHESVKRPCRAERRKGQLFVVHATVARADKGLSKTSAAFCSEGKIGGYASLNNENCARRALASDSRAGTSGFFHREARGHARQVSPDAGSNSTFECSRWNIITAQLPRSYDSW